MKQCYFYSCLSQWKFKDQRDRKHIQETTCKEQEPIAGKPTAGKMSFGHDALGNLSWAAKDDLPPVFRMPDAVGNLFKTVEKNDRKYVPAGQLLKSGSKQCCNNIISAIFLFINTIQKTNTKKLQLRQ